MSLALVLACLIAQAPETKPAQETSKTPKVIVVDEDNDGLPGLRVGPTRKELEELIVKFGRDPVSPELIERLDGLFRPRWTAQRRYDEARRRIDDPVFVELIDTAAKEASGKPADTRAFFYRAAIESTDDPTTLRETVREDIARETAPRKTIRGRVTDERNGRPIQGAVVASISGMMTKTDANGNYVLKTRPPKSTNPMGVTIEAPGYALTQTYYAWDEMKDEVTTDYRLERAVTFGGQVVDPDGKPISGAILDLWLHNEAICRDGSMQRVNFNTTVTLRAKSGPDGLFAFRNMPPDLPDRQAVIMLTATHPEYQSRTKNYAQNEELGPGWQITLNPGCVITGVVVDESGKPVKGASVHVYPNRASTSFLAVQTDAEGRFRFAGLPVGNTRLMILPRGMPYVSKEVTTDSNKPTDVKVVAETGVYLKGKVVDVDGKPVKGARVGYLQRIEANGKPSPNDGTLTQADVTKDDGTFRLGPILKGQYRVTAVLNDSRTMGTSEVEVGGKDVEIKIKPQGNNLVAPPNHLRD